MYAVKEVFYTLQGEGANTGTPAVFCRFAGCNLWSGREEDRDSATCNFCDTDFVGTDGEGGGKFATAPELADAVASRGSATVMVCSGLYEKGRGRQRFAAPAADGSLRARRPASGRAPDRVLLRRILPSIAPTALPWIWPARAGAAPWRPR